MYYVSWKVHVEGRIVEQDEGPDKVESVDHLIKSIQERWGTHSDIDIHIWRTNWMA